MIKIKNLKPKGWYEEWYKICYTSPEDYEEEIADEVIMGMERDKDIDRMEGWTISDFIEEFNFLKNLPFSSSDKKDVLETQRDIVDWVEEFINKKEIKKYLKTAIPKYDFYCEMIDYIKKTLDQGYHAIYLITNLLHMVEDNAIEEYEKLKEPEMTFPQFVRKTIKDDRLARIGEGICSGKTILIIDLENPDLTYSFIDKQQKKLRTVSHINNLGFLFEDYFALVKLGIPKEFLSELVSHSDNGADIIWKEKIYSLKFRIDRQHKTLTFRQDKDCRPEYLEALKRESTYFFVFLNPKWSNQIMIKEIHPKTDSNLIICKPNQIIVEKATKNLVI